MAVPPSWIASMANEVASQMQAFDVLAPLGCHFYLNRALDQWEVTLFVSRTEIVGGKFDGESRPSRFHLDLRGVAELFDDVAQLQWQSHPTGIEDDLGPNVSVEGTYAGHSVWLRVLADAPERFAHGRNVNAYDHRVEDVW